MNEKRNKEKLQLMQKAVFELEAVIQDVALQDGFVSSEDWSLATHAAEVLLNVDEDEV